jgi:hypothetical protein
MEIIEAIGWIALGFVPTFVFLLTSGLGKQLSSKIVIRKRGGRNIISIDKN